MLRIFKMNYFWVHANTTGAAWSRMELHGAAWSHMEPHGAAWSCMEPNIKQLGAHWGHLRSFLATMWQHTATKQQDKNMQILQEPYVSAWSQMEQHGAKWSCMEPNGAQHRTTWSSLGPPQTISSHYVAAYSYQTAG